ncbi:multidrug effflux MFS transporter [Halarcobacter sp.]|uniref:multidrug effflux MFS transporter n=1 Tax=Halarcobacter sp. TaxID=2321133 RepID=UPI003A959A5E
MKHIHTVLRHKSSESIFMTLFLALPLFTLLPMGIDLFLPALNDIQSFFLGDNSVAKFAISIYLLFWGIGQMFWGRISDIIGRRNVALIGLVVFSIASYLISKITQDSPTQFLAYRALQSFGGSACFAAIFAIIRDTFDGVKLGRAYSYLNGSLAIIPVSAPLIGAFILETNSWQYVFTLFSIIGLCSIVWTYLFTAETLVKSKKDDILEKQSTLEAYKSVVTNKNFVLYLSLTLVGFLGFMFFLTIAPLYLIGYLGVSKVSFGWMFMLIAFVFMIGSFTVPLVVEKIGIKNTVSIGILFYTFGGVLIFALSSFGIWQTYVLPMAIIAVGCTIFVSACPAFALEDFKENAGTASGLFSALNFGLSSMGATYLATVINLSSARDISLIYIIIGTLVILTYSSYSFYKNKNIAK